MTSATQDPRPEPVERFKPTSGALMGYVGLVAVVLAIGSVAWAEHTVLGLRVALGAAFVGVLIWVTQIRPRATAYRGHVELRNALRDVHVPLAAVDEVAIGQTLSLWVGDQRFVCIGIGNTLRQDMKAKRRRDLAMGTSRMSELTVKAERASYDARAVSYQTFVVTRLEELVEQAKKEPGPDAGGPTVPERRVAWPEVVALAVTGVAFVVALLL